MPDPEAANSTRNPVFLRVPLLQDIEASMQTSRRALLSGDVDALERLTQQQSATLMQLRQIISNDKCTPAVWCAAKRVLEAGRVLDFLIRRMQQRLTVAVNCSSQAQATYQPPATAPAGFVPVRASAERS